MDLKIAGRRALVTGSTSGIGFATAIGLVRLHSTPLNHAQTVPGRGRVPQQAVEITPEIGRNLTWAVRPPRATSGE